jgi:hypothetical protein
VSQVAISGPQYVPLTNPTVTITATLEDSYKNVVPVTGTTVDFENAAGNPYPGVTLSANSATTQNGVASVQATVPVYVGKTYYVNVSAAGTMTQAVPLSVVNAVAGNLTLGFTDMYQGTDSTGQYASQHSTTAAEASDTVQIVISAVDQYDQPVTSMANTTVDIQFSNKGLVPQFSTGGSLSPIGQNEWSTTLTSQGTVLVSALAETAGTVGVTATDTALAGNLSGSADFTVVPGRFSGYEVLDGSGNNVTTSGIEVQPNTPVPLLVTSVDLYGSTAVTNTQGTVNLSDGGRSGIFSLTRGGPAVTSFQFPAGQTQQPIFYENPVAGLYRISAN